MFDSEAIQDIVDFKWTTYANRIHYIGAVSHFIFIITLSAYINTTYNEGTFGKKTSIMHPILMIISISYPFIFESIQLYKSGLGYFNDPWNYIDFFFVYTSITNIVFQFTFDPSEIYPIMINGLVVMFSLMKVLFFLRVFDYFSYLVTLITSVTMDLCPFIAFYGILCYMFSLILGVLGYQNYTMLPHGKQQEMVDSKELYDGKIYESLPKIIGNMVAVVRMSLGDNEFNSIVYLGHTEQLLFWVVWLFIAYFNCIIFLNFIIAEASVSYERVMSNIENNLRLQRISLICESEEMMNEHNKND